MSVKHANSIFNPHYSPSKGGDEAYLFSTKYWERDRNYRDRDAEVQDNLLKFVFPILFFDSTDPEEASESARALIERIKDVTNKLKEEDPEAYYLILTLGETGIRHKRTKFTLWPIHAYQKFKSEWLSEEKLNTLFAEHFNPVPKSEGEIRKAYETVIALLHTEAQRYFTSELFEEEIKGFLFHKDFDFLEDFYAGWIAKHHFREQEYEFDNLLKGGQFDVQNQYRKRLEKKGITVPKEIWQTDYSPPSSQQLRE